MRTTRALLITTLLLAARTGVVAADETPAGDSGAVSVQMWTRGHLRPALWLKGQAGGWTVPLPVAAADACTARLQDISPEPLPRADRVEAIAPGQGELMLPRPRYIGSHTYRISFRCERSQPEALLAHLSPSQAEIALWLGPASTVDGRKVATR